MESRTVERFSVMDYIVFFTMLLLSAAIGLFYFIKRKCFRKTSNAAETVRDVLTGGGQMKPFPVAMSLIASYISGITMLGSPAEIYNYGTQYAMVFISILSSGVVIMFVYLPVFYKLKVHSSYEYLEIRFNKQVRTLASIFFVLDEVLFLPLLIYVPAVAFNQVTGVNIYIISIVVAIICIFYTMLGGLEAVLWTDTLQIIIMFLAVIIVQIVGSIKIGGIVEIWKINQEGGRIILVNVGAGIYERHTFFGVLIGGFCYWLSFNSVHQTIVQKYTSVPSIKKAKLAFVGFIIGVSCFILMCCYSGILIFASYKDCDPFLSNKIHATDQILPLFVMHTSAHIYGVPGLFTAGVFGAAMSTLSIILNSTSLVVLEDLVKPFVKKPLSEKFGSYITRGVTLFLGLISILSIWIVQKLGGVLSLALSLSAIAACVNCGIFTLGMLFPWSNSMGALVGAVAGGVMAGILSFGNQYMTYIGRLTPRMLPASTEGCDSSEVLRNYTASDYSSEENVFPLFRISFQWITPIGLATVLIVGLIVSYATKFTDLSTIDPLVISPISQWALPKEAQNFTGTALRRVRSRENVDVLNIVL